MKYKVILTSTAFTDLEEIKRYIALDNVNVAKKYVENIFTRLESLETMPNRGIVFHNSIFNYAKCLYIPVMNHIAIYKINEQAKCIYVTRVLSHFQDWKNIINKDLLLSHKTIADDDVLSLVHIDESMIYDIWFNSLDDNNRKFVPDEVFESLEEAHDIVEAIINGYQTKTGPFIYGVIRNIDNANLGYVQLVKIEEGWEIGYHIAKIFTGKGYATDALKLFLKHLSNTTDIKEIYGIALASNKASRRVLEKCGFSLFFEGVGIYQGKKRKIIKTIKKL